MSASPMPDDGTPTPFVSDTHTVNGVSQLAPLPAALASHNPLKWATLFGPGAIMASLTIGTGELIFSSRGGSIFGYRILCLFFVVAALKWVLVYSAARHMVLTGVHPLQRWAALPGPRGWLPAVMLCFAVMCFPIWVSFHASVIGDLLAGLSNTKSWLGGATVHVWGAAALAIVLALAAWGGYNTLERIQLVIVGCMLLAMLVSLCLLKPDWLQMLGGIFIPQALEFPDWLATSDNKLAREIAAKPVWEEATLYVGVIGGASYDYLAYTSFLRSKNWGLAGIYTDDAARRIPIINHQQILDARPWLRAPLIDCTLSFLVVLVFSAVFVAAGSIVLGPRHQIPGDGNFLQYQAQFITQLHPWLYPLYAVGTLLTMAGTLYGTLAVAPPILSECLRLVRTGRDGDSQELGRRIECWTLAWCGSGALLVLAISFAYQWSAGGEKLPGLTALLKPASLFTGVLSCGIVCWLNPWMDRDLPSEARMPLVLRLANWLAGLLFVTLGLRAYWLLGGPQALLMLGGTVAVGVIAALLLFRK